MPARCRPSIWRRNSRDPYRSRREQRQRLPCSPPTGVSRINWRRSGQQQIISQPGFSSGTVVRLIVSVRREGEDREEQHIEVFFYHLEHQTLERVLPSLLEKTLARGWRAVVQAGSEERLEALDLALWTYADDSFLPHGTARTGFASEQPVYLTTSEETPNGAGVRFLVDRAEAKAFGGAERFVYIFDGRDEEAVQSARSQWTAAKAAGCAVTYWQQSQTGRWEKRA